MKQRIAKFMPVILLLVIGLLTGCEEEFVPEISNLPPEYVVEGYVQTGPDAPPVYLILTRSLPFFSEIGPDDLNAMFVHDAVVRVNDGENEVLLDELCLSEVPPELQEQINNEFGFFGDTVLIDFCVYIDLADQVIKEPGRLYTLSITVDEEILSAVTTTPTEVPLDSLFFAPPPDPENDSMAQLRVMIADPPGEANFYRCFMRTNDGPYVSDFSTLTDDVYFDGSAFEFQLLKPEGAGEDADINTFGLYDLGDTMIIKWATIDEAHFNFWNTLEFSQANQGPFANYTRIDGNIEGGLGIWGGYTYNVYTIIVEY